MIAIILASGRGTRLQPLTDNRPKPLLEVNGKPLIKFQLDALQEYGITNCVITTGPFAEQIREYTSQYSAINFEFVHNERYAETNYIYSLYLAGKRISEQNRSEDLLLLHGDLVFDPTVIDRIVSSDSENAVIVENKEDPLLKDFCAVIGNGNVQKIGTHLEEVPIQQLYPIYRLSNRAFTVWLDEMKRLIKNGDENEYAEAALNPLLGTIELHPIAIDTFCAEVDTPSDLEMVKNWQQSVSDP